MNYKIEDVITKKTGEDTQIHSWNMCPFRVNEANGTFSIVIGKNFAEDNIQYATLKEALDRINEPDYTLQAALIISLIIQIKEQEKQNKEE